MSESKHKSGSKKVAQPIVAATPPRSYRALGIQVIVVVALFAVLSVQYFYHADKAAQSMLDKDETIAEMRKEKACDTIARQMNPTPAIGTMNVPAPALTGQTLQGKPYNLADHKGQWVFINFWATWCKTCKQEKPTLVDFAERYTEVEVVTVVTGSGWDKAKELSVDELPFPVIPDPPAAGEDYGAIGKRFALTGVPETFVVDPEGKLRYHFVGKRFWDWIGQSILRCGIAGPNAASP